MISQVIRWLSSATFKDLIYSLIATRYVHTGLAIAPDWMLGGVFGVGGFLGIYCGARVQKYMPARAIKLILSIIILFLALRYISHFF